MLRLLELYPHGCCFFKQCIDFDIGAEVSVMQEHSSLLMSYDITCSDISSCMTSLTRILLYDSLCYDISVTTLNKLDALSIKTLVQHYVDNVYIGHCQETLSFCVSP